MNYRNTEMKIDQIINYFNEEKINLSPAFQRGHVWSIGERRKLIENIVLGRPIPAIFLYKEAEGARYTYNILDGKQRLESLILFIGNQRADFSVKNWQKYFFPPSLRKGVGFSVTLPTGKKKFNSLDGKTVADLREYVIPTVEINLTDDSHLDEIINLFVDINQRGVPVKRFDIVKAMGRDSKLLKSVFNLIALEQRREQDVYYKPKQNDITSVLKTLQIVASLQDSKSQVDRMWERLIEIALFLRTKQHRKPADILKSFIRVREEDKFPALTTPEAKQLRKEFRFLANVYKKSGIRSTPLATDQTHFYTLTTSLIDSNLHEQFTAEGLTKKFTRFGRMLAGTEDPKSLGRAFNKSFQEYMDLSSDRTTDAPRRVDRQQKFLQMMEFL